MVYIPSHHRPEDIASLSREELLALVAENQVAIPNGHFTRHMLTASGGIPRIGVTPI